MQTSAAAFIFFGTSEARRICALAVMSARPRGAPSAAIPGRNRRCTVSCGSTDASSPFGRPLPFFPAPSPLAAIEAGGRNEYYSALLQSTGVPERKVSSEVLRLHASSRFQSEAFGDHGYARLADDPPGANLERGRGLDRDQRRAAPRQGRGRGLGLGRGRVGSGPRFLPTAAPRFVPTPPPLHSGRAGPGREQRLHDLRGTRARSSEDKGSLSRFRFR